MRFVDAVKHEGRWCEEEAADELDLAVATTRGNSPRKNPMSRHTTAACCRMSFRSHCLAWGSAKVLFHAMENKKLSTLASV